MLFKKSNSKKHNSKKEHSIPDDRHCSLCEYSEFHEGDSLLSSGSICHLEPKKPVVMGLCSTHSKRKEYEEQQYP